MTIGACALPENLRNELIHAADGSAIVIKKMLAVLIDSYEFFAERYPARTPSDRLEIEDLNISVREFAILPHSLAITIHAWKNGDEPKMSSIDFELDVLNECNVHMNAVSTFMNRKGVSLDGYDTLLVAQSFAVLRNTSRLLMKETQ